ncbi:MAG TPA: cysteine desulfurase [Candidatus Faecalibacterium intestinipullorum]|nr:cysteine desulfurase [Candidatus Faecalibacterium intestinipullorum]
MLYNPELHYLDNAATTIVAPEVADVIDKAMREHWANPSSLYGPGARSEEALNAARAAVARTLGCKSRELYFTSCGSESNNLAIFGGVQTKTFGKGVVVSGFEHPSVQRPMERLAEMGYDVTVVPPEPDGRLNVDKMLAHVNRSTVLVACMMVNNETGARCDVEKLAAEVKKISSRTMVHVDAVQAWMRLPIKLANIDSMAISGHKIHAPKGIGALYLSDSLAQSFRPPYLGGEQERGKRPGTENLPYALGLAAAATRLAGNMKARQEKVRALNEQLRAGLAAFPEIEINSPEGSVPEVLNFSENCIKSETMLAFLAEKQIYVSSASACGRGQPSHTLAAMGRSPLAIDTAIRVSFCADNTPEDVDAFLNRLEDGMKHLQRIHK